MKQKRTIRKLRKEVKRARSQRVGHARASHASKSISQSKSVIPKAATNLNLKQQAPKALNAQGNDGKLNAQNGALMMLQPFRAYEMGLKSGLPFQRMPQAVFGMWARDTYTITDINWAGGGGIYGSNLSINPSAYATLIQASGITASGQMSSQSLLNSSVLTFLIANANLYTVGYQGVRIRNTSNLTTQAGELVIGRAAYTDNTLAAFDVKRNAAASYVHTIADPGVVCEMTYVGKIGNYQSATITDYNFVSPTAIAFDGELSVMSIATKSTVPQTWDIEVVTYYLLDPFAISSAFLQPNKYCVDLDHLDMLVDTSLTEVPMYTVERTCFKDDGYIASVISDVETIYKGASIVYDWGRKAVNWIGDAFSSLFGTDPARAALIILHQIPPEHFEETMDYLSRGDSYEQVFDSLQKAIQTTKAAESVEMYKQFTAWLNKSEKHALPADTPKLIRTQRNV